MACLSASHVHDVLVVPVASSRIRLWLLQSVDSVGVINNRRHDYGRLASLSIVDECSAE